MRHESAEALGAIGSDGVLDVLSRFISDHSTEVSETCQIAVDLVQWKLKNVSPSIVIMTEYFSAPTSVLLNPNH